MRKANIFLCGLFFYFDKSFQLVLSTSFFLHKTAHLPNRKMARVHATFVYCIKSCEKTPFEKSFGNPQTFKFHQQLGIVFDFCFALNKQKTSVV